MSSNDRKIQTASLVTLSGLISVIVFFTSANSAFAQSYTTPGVYTYTVGNYAQLNVQIAGGGGGGGGWGGSYNYMGALWGGVNGGAGGSGGYTSTSLTVSPGQQFTFYVGGGGGGGAFSYYGSAGGGGGSSYFGGYMAGGGGGGGGAIDDQGYSGGGGGGGGGLEAGTNGSNVGGGAGGYGYGYGGTGAYWYPGASAPGGAGGSYGGNGGQSAYLSRYVAGADICLIRDVGPSGGCLDYVVTLEQPLYAGLLDYVLDSSGRIRNDVQFAYVHRYNVYGAQCVSYDIASGGSDVYCTEYEVAPVFASGAPGSSGSANAGGVIIGGAYNGGHAGVGAYGSGGNGDNGYVVITQQNPVSAGACGTTHYSCSAGTSANNAVQTTSWTWSCLGSNGGTTASCSEAVPLPTVAWAPTSVSYSYGGTVPGFGYSSTNASSCILYDSANGSLIVSGFPTSNYWPAGTFGPPLNTTSWGRTLVCYDSSGLASNPGYFTATVGSPASCAATTIGNCSLPATSSGSSAGSCASGYAGSCSYSCSNGTWNEVSNSCISSAPDLPDLPDLTAGVVSPVSATAGTAQTFSATISNTGSGSSGTAFNNFMQVATAINGGGTITDISSVNMPTLTGGGTNTFSKSYTFASAGTFSLRVCADKSSSTNAGTITESNEGNNCGGWTTITVTVAASTCSNGANNPTACTQCPNGLAYIGSSCVSCTGGCSGVGGSAGNSTGSLVCNNGASNPINCNAFPPDAPSATLSANPSTVDSGQSSTLSWNSTGATCTGTGFTAGGASGNRSTGTLGSLGTYNYQVVCAGPGGTSLPAFASVVVLAPTADISANPIRVSSGNNTTLTWNATGVTSCVVTGPSGTLASGNANASHVFSTGSPRSLAVAGQSTYTITCQTVGGNQVAKSVTVNILPAFQEF